MKEFFRKLGKGMRAHKGRTALIIFAVFLLIIGIGAGIVYGKLRSYYKTSNYVEIEIPEVTQKNVTEEEPEDPELKEIREQLDKHEGEEPITTDGKVYNILLIGLDKAEVREGKGSNSDTMILLSLNYEKEQISMVSLMRDTYAYIPGIGYRKLNAAYANGEAGLLLQTVTENFRVEVDRYMTVSFQDMANIVDLIGGVSLTFTAGEAENANRIIESMCNLMGRSSEISSLRLPGAGTYDCNGMQAVAYARIRKIGNSDYQRTERQREVLSKLFNKVKTMKIDDIDKLANNLLPMVTHNVPEKEYWGMLAKVPSMLRYDMVQERIPYDNLFYTKNEFLIPHADETVARLKETLYGIESEISE